MITHRARQNSNSTYNCIGDGAATTVWCPCGHVWTCRLNTALQFFHRPYDGQHTADSRVEHGAAIQGGDELNKSEVIVIGTAILELYMV
ncbi:hypothetical protein J6590_035657 [Homalodisca vitripennis]|nr:hypothetical protein J6590_035657 [Homalodisca vitripennis]